MDMDLLLLKSYLEGIPYDFEKLTAMYISLQKSTTNGKIYFRLHHATLGVLQYKDYSIKVAERGERQHTWIHRQRSKVLSGGPMFKPHPYCQILCLGRSNFNSSAAFLVPPSNHPTII